jgi:hypothetical protein
MSFARRLVIVFASKIGITVFLWCIPLLLFPEWLLTKLGFPPLKPLLFIRLLGMAYLALVVGYFYGLKTAALGGHPREIATVGLVSNAGAFFILSAFGLRGSWSAWGGGARAAMWLSVLATAGISAGLIAFGRD